MGVAAMVRLGLLGAGENEASYPCQVGRVEGIFSCKHFPAFNVVGGPEYE